MATVSMESKVTMVSSTINVCEIHKISGDSKGEYE
jgi:hypothetical protein